LIEFLRVTHLRVALCPDYWLNSPGQVAHTKTEWRLRRTIIFNR